MTENRVMYCCTFCADNNPEMCGFFDRDNLVVMPDGRWLCDSCFDETDPEERGSDPEGDGLCRSDFPHPPEYGPLSGDPVGQKRGCGE